MTTVCRGGFVRKPPRDCRDEAMQRASNEVSGILEDALAGKDKKEAEN